jgi:CheY-like chemotaxis protein
VQGKPRVLLIEDHDDTGSMFASCLTQRGYEVTYVRSLKEGLALADKGWDVVLSDIGLADGSGLEIARHAQGRGAEPPHRIAVSGYGSDADVKASRDAGFDCHLVKPVDLEALLELIARREHAGTTKTTV